MRNRIVGLGEVEVGHEGPVRAGDVAGTRGGWSATFPLPPGNRPGATAAIWMAPVETPVTNHGKLSGRIGDAIRGGHAYRNGISEALLFWRVARLCSMTGWLPLV